jgi:peptide/nickel transport system permease protein
MKYIGSRLLQSLLTLLVFMIAIFIATRAAGDPVQLLLPPDATPDEVQATRHRFGTDRPYVEQFVTFLKDMGTFNFGRSIVHREQVTQLIAGRVGASVSLILAAVSLVLLTSVPLGVLAATHRARLPDRIVRTVAAVGQASPGFWIGLMLIELFGVRLHLLPAGGYPSDGSVAWQYYVLPAVTIGLPLFAALTRLLRSSMLESLNAEFVTLARAKGLSELRVVWVHVLRNACLPILTLMAIWVGTAVVGSVVAEVVFNWPGVGNLFLSSILARDFPVIQAVVALLGTTVLLANMLADLLYVVVDPRIRGATGAR